MGVFDKFLDIMKLNDDEYDDDDFYDDDFEDDDFDEKPHRSIFGNKKSRSDDFDDFDMDEDKHLAPSSGNKVTPMRQPAARRGVNMEVCVVKPTSVDDSREITETLLAGRTVILNLEGMDLEIAQRIIDFISGATFAISGNLQKISNYIFLVTPTNVDISGDLQDLLGGSMEKPQLEKRLSELSNLAYSHDIVTYSDFLNLNELNILHSMPKDRLYTKFVTFGGYGLAERQMAAFLPDALSLRGEMSWCSEEEWGDYPFDILRISPLHAKYAEQLTHRDYLGTILGLGIERAKIGDILVDGTDAVVFVHRTLQSFLMEELTRVRHTQVLVKEISREDFQYEPKYEEIRGTVASVRLDSLLSLAFSASRTKLSGLIEGAKVFVNGKLITTNSYQLKENDVISVRGYGKFRYNGTGAKTKKNRIYVSVYKYI